MRRTSLSLLRKTVPLVGGRAVQVVLGFASTLVMTRTLGPSGFGEVATVLAVAGVVGGVVGNALSDSGVLGLGPKGTRPLRIAALVLGASLAAGAVARHGDRAALALGLIALGVNLGTVIGTAPRLVAARTAGRALRLAMTHLAGSGVSLLAVGSLALLGVDSWGPYTLAAALAPVMLWTLPKPADPTTLDEGATPRSLVSVLPFALSQASWVLVAQLPIFVLRALVGARAAGEYGALARLVELASVVRPLAATFALPIFHRLAGEGASGRRETELLNLGIAASAFAVVGIVSPLSWIYWQVAYPGVELPRLVLGVLVTGLAAGVAAGIPNRILEAEGRAPFVSRIGVVTALSALVLSVGLAGPFGLVGVASIRALAAVAVPSLVLLVLRPRGLVRLGHAALAVLALALGGASVWVAGRASIAAAITLSIFFSLGPLGVVGGVGMWLKSHRG